MGDCCIDKSCAMERLRERLRTSPYWAHRFQAFSLSIDDLVKYESITKNMGEFLSACVHAH